MLTTNVHFITGCDGSYCDHPEAQISYPLDDMPNVSFCQCCWTQEMNRRKRMREGNILSFPSEIITRTNNHVPVIRYLDFDNTRRGKVEKIRRSHSRFVDEI